MEDTPPLLDPITSGGGNIRSRARGGRMIVGSMDVGEERG